MTKNENSSGTGEEGKSSEEDGAPTIVNPESMPL